MEQQNFYGSEDRGSPGGGGISVSLLTIGTNEIWRTCETVAMFSLQHTFHVASIWHICQIKSRGPCI